MVKTKVERDADKGSARERLLAAADALFYAEGVHTVGIDRVIEKAGVAKASLYSTFGSKEALVRAYLTARHERWRGQVEGALAARFDTPRARLLGVFDVLGELIASPDFRGCAFINASAEAVPGGAIEQVSGEFREWLQALFLGLCRAAGVAHPARLTQELVLLYDGASVKGQMDHDLKAANLARRMAALLIDEALPR